MAPKNKYTKDEMIAAAVNVVRKKGIGGLTAKTMAEELGTSTQPVFTYFSSMDELKGEVRVSAERIYSEYALKGLGEKVPFFGFGVQYIKFAKEEPELYRLIFLTPTPDGKNGALEAMRHSCGEVSGRLERIYNISREQAERYFRDMWLVVHSIATLSVTGGCPYSDDEIGKILTGFSVSLCMAIKEIDGFESGNFDRDEVFRKLING